MTSKPSFSTAADAFRRLCQTMVTLRQQCPWDKKQTTSSLRRYLLEETYELYHVMGGPSEQEEATRAQCEELGDVLFQVVFQAQIRSEEQNGFAIDHVIDGVREKLERRHPRIFDPDNPARHDLSWAQLKAEEKDEQEGPADSGSSALLANIPSAAPALLRALLVGETAARAGFDWPTLAGVRAKVLEEWRELEDEIDRQEAGPRRRARQQEELGDLLFALVSYGRHLGLDPEAALHGSLQRFEQRLGEVENSTERPLDTYSSTELEALWQRAKTVGREGVNKA